MTPGMKRLLLVIGGLSLAVALCVTGVVLYVQHAGVLIVQVQEGGRGGSNVRISLPAAVVQLAVDLAPRTCCREAADRMKRLHPVLVDLCRQMQDSPDFTLLKATSERETVEISKSGNKLLVEVQSQEDRVHMQIPFPLVSHVLARI